MPIKGYESLCEEKQKIIVSKDNGKPRQHIANNKLNKVVFHYRVDGDIIHDGEKCDFLLLDDECKIAYFIELKGADLCKAARQIDSAQEKLKDELKEYTKRYRIVASKCKTTEILSTSFKSYKKKWHNALVYGTDVIQEDI